MQVVSSNVTAQERAADALSQAPVYRLRRDALMVVANLNRGLAVVDLEAMKRQVVFAQGMLCAAALSDAKLSSKVKAALMAFQQQSVREATADRRTARASGADQ